MALGNFSNFNGFLDQFDVNRATFESGWDKFTVLRFFRVKVNIEVNHYSLFAGAYTVFLDGTYTHPHRPG